RLNGGRAMRTREMILSLTAGLTLVTGTGFAQPKPEEPKPNQPAKPSEPPKNQQKPAPAPDSLEALMADALKFNPNIQAAESNVREAQAKLNKAKNEVLVEIAAAHKIVVKARDIARMTEDAHKLRELSFQRGQLSQTEFLQGKIELARAQATLAVQEADLMKLVGRVPGQPEQHGSTQNTDARWIDMVTYPQMVQGTTDFAPWFLGSTLHRPGSYMLMADGSVRLMDVNNTSALFLNNIYGSMAAYNPRINAPAASIADKIKEALERPLK